MSLQSKTALEKLLDDLRNESDLCRNEHADDIANLIDRAVSAILSLSHTSFHFEICPTHQAQGARFIGEMPCCISAEREDLRDVARSLSEKDIFVWRTIDQEYACAICGKVNGHLDTCEFARLCKVISPHKRI